MTVRVSDEAVEAAAKEYMPSMSHPGHERDEVRAILEAAAPIILRDNQQQLLVEAVGDLMDDDVDRIDDLSNEPPFAGASYTVLVPPKFRAALLAAFTREDRHGS